MYTYETKKKREKIVDLSRCSMKKIRELIVFTAFLVVALWKFDVVIEVLKSIWKIVFPFALGGAIAFVINVPMSFLEKKMLGKIKENNKIGKKAARPISLLLTIILAAGVMVLVMFGVIPQLTQTMGNLMTSISDFIPQMQNWIREISHDNQDIMKLVDQLQFQPDQAIKSSWQRCWKYDEYDDVSSRFHCQWISDLFYFVFLCMLYSFSEGKITFTGKKSDFRFYSKTKSRCNS